VADFPACNPNKLAPLGCYNKSTCANRVVTKISPLPSVTMLTAQSSISKPYLPMKKETQPLTLKEPNFADPGF